MIPAKVSSLVQKMVEKEPEKRFQNMEEVIQAIWEVRQLTAPDKDLVPSVHTISIKRLDYDLQKLSQERKKHISEEKIKEQQKTAVLSKFLMIGIPIILSVILLFAIIFSQKSKLQMQDASAVKALNSLVERQAMSPSELMARWEDLDAKLRPPKDDFDRELRTRMLLLKERIDNYRLQLSRRELLEKSKETQKNVSKKIRQQIAANKRRSEILHQKELALKKREKQLKKTLDKLKNSTTDNTAMNQNRLAERLKHLTVKYNTLWQNDVRVKFYYLSSKGKTDEAGSIIKASELDYPGFEQWHNIYMQTLKRIKKFSSSSVSHSGSKYAGIKDQEGEITNIFEGKVTLKTKTGETKEIPLLSLSLQSLLSIAERIFPDQKKEDLVMFLVIMTDRIREISSSQVISEELKAICNAVCEYRIDRIKKLYFIDTKKAKDEARSFLTEFGNVPEMNEKYKPALKELFLQ
jgi:serine/threonine protein kinase